MLASACGEGQIGSSGGVYSDTSIGEPYAGEVDEGNDTFAAPDLGDPGINEPDVADPEISNPGINDPDIDDSLPTEDPPANDLPPQMPPADDSDRPWAYNTGPKDLNALVPSGAVTLSSPGVYENLDIRGDI
jgi:hypothetical protein